MLRKRTYRNRIPRRGQGLVEYGMILVLISAVVAASLLLLGPQMGSAFSYVRDRLCTAGMKVASCP